VTGADVAGFVDDEATLELLGSGDLVDRGEAASPMRDVVVPGSGTAGGL
jgi:hypothetical protein